MKKAVLALVAALSALVMCLGLAACSSDVAGNTYVFDSFTYEYADSVPDDEKLTQEEIDALNETMKGQQIVFNTDGTCFTQTGEDKNETYYYVQDGNKVYVLENKEDTTDKAEIVLEVDGSKVIMSEEYEGTTSKVIFKKK